MRSKVFFKLMAAFVVVIAVTTLVLDFSIRREWDRSLRHEINQSLTEKVHLFALRVQAEKPEQLSEIVKQVAVAANARATVIDAAGMVLADSEADPKTMENHATRPEFVAALHGGIGTDTRESHTVKVEFLYVAASIPGGAVRLAYPLARVKESTDSIRRNLIFASLLALLLSGVLAIFFARAVAGRLQKIVGFAEKVASGDLSARISESSFDEIAQVASALDSTARKLEETFAALQVSKLELETLLNSIPNPVIAVSPDRKLQWANQHTRSFESAEMRIGAPLIESFRCPDLLRCVDDVITQSEPRSAVIVIPPAKTFNVTVAPMPGGGAVAILQDVTEIERVEKTRRDFIANVSHELRTPLTSVRGYVETLLDGKSDLEQARGFLQIIHSNAARMSRLTDDLLTLARVESGDTKLALTPVPVKELLDEARTNFSGITSARGIELVAEPGPDCEVIADKDSIQQVFSNLIENASKYAPSGTRIIIGAKLQPDVIEFYVRDFGGGIALGHQPRLFERFYRVDPSRSRESGGTGLGLAIVKHIILNHGGTVRVESQLNHGATFLFTLPLVLVSQPAVTPN